MTVYDDQLALADRMAFDPNASALAIVPREELTISQSTAELLELVDLVDDGDDIAQALEVALLALVDISGSDPLRVQKAVDTKIARRTLDRLRKFLETAAQKENDAT